MKYIITNMKNEITDISNTYSYDAETRNVKLDDYSIAYAPDERFNVYNVEVPENVKPMEYCYTQNDGFYINPNYSDPVKPLEERIDILETNSTEYELALAEIYEELINNG